MVNQQSVTDARSICATRAYTVPELADMWKAGERRLCREIKRGKLRAARFNDRGDWRVLGSWALEYLESLAKLTQKREAATGSGRPHEHQPIGADDERR